MTSLIAAHRGYEYQDLLVACRLVDVILGTVVQVQVDEKLTDNDRFDDLSTIDVDGRRERTQFKHTENADRPLSLAAFTTDSRNLRLDRVIESILADRNGPGQHAQSFSYRILLRDFAPVDPALKWFVDRHVGRPAVHCGTGCGARRVFGLAMACHDGTPLLHAAPPLDYRTPVR